jgi:hypothetical protein
MKIRLFRPHTHAGVTYPAFSVIDLPDEDALRVLELEGGVRQEMIAAAIPEPEPEPETTEEPAE